MVEQPTREKAHALQAKHMEQVQKQHPKADLKLDSGWWKPGTDFTFDIQERLDGPTNDKMNAILQRLYSQKLEPDAAAQIMEELRECLKGHPDLVERFDVIFNPISPDLLAVVNAQRQQGGACSGSEERSTTDC